MSSRTAFHAILDPMDRDSVAGVVLRPETITPPADGPGMTYHPELIYPPPPPGTQLRSVNDNAVLRDDHNTSPAFPFSWTCQVPSSWWCSLQRVTPSTAWRLVGKVGGGDR